MNELVVETRGKSKKLYIAFHRRTRDDKYYNQDELVFIAPTKRLVKERAGLYAKSCNKPPNFIPPPENYYFLENGQKVAFEVCA